MQIMESEYINLSDKKSIIFYFLIKNPINQYLFGQTKKSQFHPILLFLQIQAYRCLCYFLLIYNCLFHYFQSISMNIDIKEHIVLKETKESKEDFEREVIEGLSRTRKCFPFKYNYDLRGSKILEEIQQQKQYYPWRCDKEILENKGGDILKFIGQNKFNLIDLGAGDGTKTKILLRQAIQSGYDVTYIPLDISYHSNIDLIKACSEQLPTLKMKVLTGQYEDGINWIKNNTSHKNVFLFPGSTFGNTTDEKNKNFLTMIYSSMKKNDQLFLGLDIWKNPEMITRAYLDNGRESSFILNILVRINNELNGNFDLQQYHAFPYFDPYQRNIRGVLTPKIDQEVQIGTNKFLLKQAEPIELFISRKWLISDIEAMFENVGLTVKTHLDDQLNSFKYFVIEKSS